MTELIGQAPSIVRDPEEQHAAVQQLRLAMSSFDFLAVLLRPGHAETASTVTTPASVRQENQRAWELIHGALYAEAAPVLCELLESADHAARSAVGASRADAFHAAAEVYQTVAAMMAKLGEVDLAWVAADRSVMAAEVAGAPLLAAAGAFRLALAFLSGGRTDQAQRAAETASNALRPWDEDERPERVALFGALSLILAVIASRSRHDGVAARRWLAEAERAANHLGEDRNDFETEFGPSNVALHAVSIAVELGEAGEAIRRARTLAIDHLSAERRARLLIDLARAHAQRRDSAAAVAALTQADAIAPEQVRYHGLVRELVRDLLRRQRSAPSPELTTLATAAGILVTTPGAPRSPSRRG